MIANKSPSENGCPGNLRLLTLPEINMMAAFILISQADEGVTHSSHILTSQLGQMGLFITGCLEGIALPFGAEKCRHLPVVILFKKHKI